MSEFTNPNLEVLITTEQIQDRIRAIGADIARDYAGKNPLMIGVLKGACTFLSDLMRAADIPLGVELWRSPATVRRCAHQARCAF